MLLLSLLPRALAFERKISDLLGPRIQLAQLLFWIGLTADGLYRGILNFPRVADVFLDIFSDQLLPFVPERLRRRHFPAAIVKEDDRTEIVFRRHVLFSIEFRDILQF